MEHKPFVITIVGPESSGKTTLARQLAADIGCPWVPEYARKYLEVLGREYNEDDLSLISEGQLAAFYEAVSSIQSTIGSQQSAVFSPQSAVSSIQSAVGNLQSSVVSRQSSIDNSFLVFHREDFGDEPRPVVIVDSGMMGMRVWAKLKYNLEVPLVEEALKEDVTSMYILCRPVLPWEADPLREAPTLLARAWIYNHFLKEMFLTQVK